jgi:kelch-like protein 9/13
LFSVCALAGLLYVVGGLNGHGPVGEVTCYDPRTSQWTRLAPLTEPRYKCAVSAVDGRLYVAGGATNRHHVYHEQTFASATECYDPVRKSWAICRPMPTPRAGCIGVATGSAWFVVGGDAERPNMPRREVERYCTRTDTWTAVAPLPLAENVVYTFCAFAL